MSRRPRRLVALGALLGLLAVAGCSGDDGDSASGEGGATPTSIVTFDFSGTAATVNGVPIPAQVIADQVAAFSVAPEAVQAALGDVPDLFQEGSDQPQPVIVADLLQTEIMVNLIQAELATRGIAPTEDEQRIARTNVRASFGPAFDKLPVVFTDELVQRNAEFIALDVALNPTPPEEELQAAYTGEPTKWERACARHILVTSQADAQDVLTQLQGGADFAELARTRSQDSGSAPQGGDLGCLARGETAGAFEAALWEGPVGEVQGPITSDVGIHLVQVASRGVPPYEQARESIILDKRSDVFTELGAWVTVKSVRSDITVDPRFGTWDATIGHLRPVDGSQSGLTLTPGPTTEAPASSMAPPTTAGAGLLTTTTSARR